MLTAQPSTYDMFGLIELYGRKLQSDKKAGRKELGRWEHLLFWSQILLKFPEARKIVSKASTNVRKEYKGGISKVVLGFRNFLYDF